jgi:hypothetical protein
MNICVLFGNIKIVNCLVIAGAHYKGAGAAGLQPPQIEIEKKIEIL